MALHEGNVDASKYHGKESCRSVSISIENLLRTRMPPITSDCCIYRVGKSLCDLNKAAYTPRVLTIGPFHHGKHGLEFMEKIKESYLLEFVNRTKLSLEDLIAFTEESEARIRSCYAEPIELKGEPFVKMILLDASFVIEHFVRSTSRAINDHVFFSRRIWSEISDDLSLLENQLPFWFLAKLYDLAFGSNDHEQIPFLKLSYWFFSYYNKQDLSPKADDHIYHFTDLIRTFYLPATPREKPVHIGKHKQFTCGAGDLRATGVHFKGISSSRCLFDIKFNPTNGELLFPHFEVEDRTESLFRNLMAFEQYHYLDNTYICDYILLVDRLINTTNDVDLLTRKGCITNRLGGQDVLAALFNSLGREILHNRNDSYFCKVAQELGDYYDKPWHNYKATLKQDYFSTPWKIASTVAAVILLILTLIQTVNSFNPS